MTVYKYSILVLTIMFATILHAEDKTVRILAIGNSFSQDAVEQYLQDLVVADGQQAIIGNMFIGGCSLERHWQNAERDSSAYSYRKRGLDGIKVTTSSVSLSKALKDEEWDYISLQQSSDNSGLYDTYQPYLQNLIAYIKKYTKSDVKIIWHQTWAYAANCTNSGFNNYNRDQMTMYQAIMDASKKAVNDNGLALVIPSGTAVQNARTTFIGDNMNRDGYHLNVVYGRYTAACTWYETIFGKSVVGNSYSPEGMTKDLINATQAAAHAAVIKPYAVTDLSYIHETFSNAKVFVRPDDSDSALIGDGSSWNKALPYSQLLKQVKTFDKGVTVCLAGGKYYPIEKLRISNAINLIGGFDPDLRDTTDVIPIYPSRTPTVISGDKDRDGQFSTGDLPTLISVDMSKATSNAYPVCIKGLDLTGAYSSVEKYDSLGAIYFYDTQAGKVSNCYIYNNKSESYGGIALRAAASNIHVTDCDFHDNHADSRGGAIRLSSNNKSKGLSTIERSSLWNNGVNTNVGAAICVQHGLALYIINTSITGNTSASGGAIYANGADDNYARALYLVNSTIAGNGGNQIQMTQSNNGAQLHMANSIIVGNEDRGDEASSAIVITGNAKKENGEITSGGFNIIGTLLVADANAAAPQWNEADSINETNTLSTIFDGSVRDRGLFTPKTTTTAGGYGESLGDNISTWNLPDANLSVDIQGNPRGKGTTPGAIAGISTGIAIQRNNHLIKSAIYNLQGVKLSREPEKGIFIVNGQKIVK
jgi:predicted outer membrane repeat protein